MPPPRKMTERRQDATATKKIDMKIPSSSDRNRSLNINMTPMIDVVFLLIIFFLVSSHLARRENDLPLDLPTADSGQDVKDVEAARVTLNVEADGRLTLAGSTIGSDELPDRLMAARKRQGKDLELRIRADRTVSYRHVSPVLRAAAKSQIWNVSFAVVKN